MNKYLSKVFYVLTGSKSSLIFLMLVFILTSVLEAVGIGLIGPFLRLASEPEFIHKVPALEWIYIQFSLTSSRQVIPILGLGIVALFCIKSLGYFFARYYIFKFTFDQKRLQSLRLFNAYLTVPYTFHLSRNTASLIKNIILETNQFTLNCLQPILESAANLVVIVVLLLLLAKTNLLLLVMIMAILLPTFITFYRLGGKFKRWGKIVSESQKEIIRTINHGLGGLKETRVIGCESYFGEQMEAHTLKHEKAATLFNTSQLLPRILIETSLIAFVVLFISISQLFLKQSSEDLTSVMGVFAIASMRLIPSASQLIQGIGRMRNGSYALDMLYFDLKELDREKVEKDIDITANFPDGKLLKSQPDERQVMPFLERIELRDITYRYGGTSDPALKEISLTIKKGESIALIGKSGSGKTTLVDVILGLLQPENGDILVDGVSVYNNLRYWQDLIGYIPQSIFLTDDTIERNIAFGVPDGKIDPGRINKAIKAAQLEELVEELPDGIKTGVGERGIRLSGGQRQRIGIARALYHEREILVLDEATAALDTETERLVSEAISSLAGTKTLIIIAHRLSTVEHCDRIYLLEKGTIIKSGSYQEVVG